MYYHHAAVFCLGCRLCNLRQQHLSASTIWVLAGDGQGADGDIGLDEGCVDPACAVG
jgi:hypothetical protein